MKHKYEPNPCFKDFLSSRAASFPKSKSGLYYENLEGINVQKVAHFTEEKTAQEFLDQVNEFACLQTIDDLLHNVPQLRYNEIYDFYDAPVWRTDAGNIEESDATYSGDFKGVTFKKEWREYQTLSTFVVKRIAYKAFVDVAEVLILLQDGSKTVVFDEEGEWYEVNTFDAYGRPDNVIDDYETVIPLTDLTLPTVQADEELTLQTNYKVENYEFSVVTENYQIPLYKTTAASNRCGCEYSMNRVFYRTGDVGIALDINYECMEERLQCALLQRAKWAILYNAGIKILDQWDVSNDLNFVSLHNNDEAMKLRERWQAKYDKEMSRLTRTVRNFVLKLDRTCFECETNKMLVQHT